MDHALKCILVLQQWEEEVARLSSALQEKTRENQRLRKSFDTIKQGNDGLKRQVWFHPLNTLS